MDEPEKQGFVDAVATAFLHRRLHSRRLRAAAVRGVKTVSAGTGSALKIDFDHAARCFDHAPSWLTAHDDELAARREAESEKFGTKVGTKRGGGEEGVPEVPESAGAGGGSRTRDLLITNPDSEQTQQDQENPTEQSGDASA